METIKGAVVTTSKQTFNDQSRVDVTGIASRLQQNAASMFWKRDISGPLARTVYYRTSKLDNGRVNMVHR